MSSSTVFRNTGIPAITRGQVQLRRSGIIQNTADTTLIALRELITVQEVELYVRRYADWIQRNSVEVELRRDPKAALREAIKNIRDELESNYRSVSVIVQLWKPVLRKVEHEGPRRTVGKIRVALNAGPLTRTEGITSVLGKRALTGEEALEILAKQGAGDMLSKDRPLSAREIRELRAKLRRTKTKADPEVAVGNFVGKTKEGSLMLSEANRLLRLYGPHEDFHTTRV